MRFTSKGVLTGPLKLEDLLKQINEYSIWCYYTGIDIKLGKKVLSPVRKESDPSAVFFVSNKGNILLKDFGGETWNLLKYLKYRNISLLQVARDFGVVSTTQGTSTPRISPNALLKHFKIPEGTSARIWVKRKRWSKEELQFWADYHITKETLDFYHISPLGWYAISKNEDYIEYYNKKELIFVFSFGNALYKIYRPMGDKKRNKWYCNAPKDTLMGYDQLPWVGETLFIMKGMKELCIMKELEFTAVSLQGETSYPCDDIVQQLKKRFKRIIVCMDNDKAGNKANLWFSENWMFKSIQLPDGFKDLAEFTHKRGLEDTKSLIESQI